MYKFKIALLFFILSILSFSKEFTIHFNIPSGSIRYYKTNDKTFKTFDFYNSKATFNLDEEIYTFLFFNKEYAPIVKEIDIKKIPNEIYIEFSKKEDVIINGVVKSKNNNVGGSEIQFIDNLNRGYSTTSDYLGNFQIKLPKGNYKVNINKFGYTIKKNSPLIYEFTSSAKPYNLTINLDKIPSFVEGRVIDEKRNPIINAQVTIKNGAETFYLKTDEYGKFKKEVSSGIVTLICSKPGFFTNGSVRKIESDSSIPNLEIVLTKTKFNIQGVVTDGVKALPKIVVTIHDEDINKITSVTSDENGYYEFANIEGDKEVFISINDPKYKRLKTDLFRLDKNINDFNLILEEK